MTPEQRDAAAATKRARDLADRAFKLSQSLYNNRFYTHYNYYKRAVLLGVRLYNRYFDRWNTAHRVFGSSAALDRAIETLN